MAEKMEPRDSSSANTRDMEKRDIVPGTEHHKAIPDPDAHLSPEERAQIDKKLLRKLDFKLIPWLCLLYLVSFLDRTNIGNASIAGLRTDLGLSDTQYTLSLTIFFISYSVFEPATQIMLKRFKPSVFLPATMLLWGICMTTMGLVHNWGGLMAARWFLGLTEAGLFPGVNYYLSSWYKRTEFGIRAAVFFSAAAIAGSFGGLLAAGIAKMDGVGGKQGWAWIFILEGLFTILIGIASFWMVHDFPDEAKFLSEDDRRRVVRRLKEDMQSSAEHEEFKFDYLWATLKDWKTYNGMLIYMGVDGALYAFSLFLPTIINQLGYTSTTAQLLSVPPYVLACLLTILVGYIADRTRQRGICNICVSCLGIVGYAMLLGSSRPGVQYAGTYLAAMGVYPGVPNTISWTANNVEGVYKRGITLGFVIGWGNLNGVVSSNIYRTRDAPRFLPGHGVVIAYLTLFYLGGSILQTLYLRNENKKRARGDRDGWTEGLSEKEIEKRGDMRPDFQYVT